ncbi:MAG: hypothetical protein WCI72_00040 [archaeon]
MEKDSLRNHPLKKGDLVLLVWDVEGEGRDNIALLGSFYEFVEPQKQFDEFRGSVYYLGKPHVLPCGIKIPSVANRSGYLSNDTHMVTADRIYVGEASVKQAISQDPVVKKLLTLSIAS